MGLQLWLEPLTSLLALAFGAIAGLAVAYALGESVGLGLAAGGGVALAILGVRALASILATLDQPPTMASPRAWFSR
jgi:hypothetical protein